MSFSPNLPAAARRHLHAADALFDTAPHKAVAGYLYGIAAECAVKALLEQAGLRPLDLSKRRHDPLYAHFPELRTFVRDSSQGRLHKTVRELMDDDRFMNQWSTDMRYAPGRDVRPEWVESWRKQARNAVACIDT
jgi:hypothetical protein